MQDMWTIIITILVVLPFELLVGIWIGRRIRRNEKEEV